MTMSICRKQWLVLLLCATTAPFSAAQRFTTVLNFDNTNGASPGGSLVQGADGSLYGTTSYGGTSDAGTIFKINPQGALATIYNFCGQPNCADGANPDGLVLASDGRFYGVTGYGGAACDIEGGCGTVFKVTPGGKLTTLYRFCAQPNCMDGASPFGALVQATDGSFYGTTYDGGEEGDGTVFKITSKGTLTRLYSFDATHGSRPEGGLIQATDGNLYGTTQAGGNLTCDDPIGCGTVFQITLAGTLKTLHRFNGADGAYPESALVEATAGNLYGTTVGGGRDSSACDGGCGTVFTVTPRGTVMTLYSFCSQTDCTDGTAPIAGLIQANDRNFYGTTYFGGDLTCNSGVGCGTAFKITSMGKVTTLHSFDGVDGEGPVGGLVQSTGGGLYGTTALGGTSSNCYLGCGTVYSLR